jgi:TRAP-type C4-dicarboxylate transport system permease large subunit
MRRRMGPAPPPMPKVGATQIDKVFTAALGSLTPFGLGVFMIAGIAGVPFDRVVKATIPFLAPPIVTIILPGPFPGPCAVASEPTHGLRPTQLPHRRQRGCK